MKTFVRRAAAGAATTAIASAIALGVATAADAATVSWYRDSQLATVQLSADEADHARTYQTQGWDWGHEDLCLQISRWINLKRHETGLALELSQAECAGKVAYCASQVGTNVQVTFYATNEFWCSRY